MTDQELIEKVEEIRVHEICASREDCKGCPFDDGNYNCCLAMTIEALERLINADENLKKLEEDQADDIREENRKGILKMTNLEIVNGLRIAMSEICKEYMYEQSCYPCPFYKCDTCLIQEAVNEIDVNILLDNGVEIVNEEAEEWKEKYKRLEEFVLSLTRLGKGGTNVEKLFGHYTITKTVLAEKTGVEDLMEEGFWK